MLYEKHTLMRVSVTSWTPPSDPAAAPNGRIKESAEGPLWYASTNPEEVAKAILALNETTTLNVSSVGGHPERSTSFDIKYGRSDQWNELTAATKVAMTIEAVNKPPRELTTAFPAGYVYPSRPERFSHRTYSQSFSKRRR